MPVFYHVARFDISALTSLELRSVDDHAGSIELLPIWTSEDFKNTLRNYYPDGISGHGTKYLYDPFNPVKDDIGNDYYAVSPMVETTFEMVRKWKFPESRSRFQSFFACLTIEDAKKIKATTFKGVGMIFAVECENHFIADMNLLVLGNSYVGNLIYAEKYWRGERSGNPFLEVLMQGPVKILDHVPLS